MLFELLNRMLDALQDHKSHSPGKDTTLQLEHKTAMQIDESAISLLLIE